MDHHSLQWLKSMKSETAILPCCQQELEEFSFEVKHWPGKSQNHTDVLCHLPADPQENCATMHFSDEVRAELQEWTDKSKERDPMHQSTVSIGGCSYDRQGRIRVGPKVSHHLMGVLHCSTTGHLQ